MPRVLNKKTDGWSVNTVYCGRGSPYGNPFPIGQPWNGVPMDRDTVCDRFEREILPTLDVSELKGKDLVCFCAPKRCHCDSILKKANEEYQHVNRRHLSDN